MQNRCIFDHDRSRLAAADAVLFHGPDLVDVGLPPPESRYTVDILIGGRGYGR